MPPWLDLKHDTLAPLLTIVDELFPLPIAHHNDSNNFDLIYGSQSSWWATTSVWVWLVANNEDGCDLGFWLGAGFVRRAEFLVVLLCDDGRWVFVQLIIAVVDLRDCKLGWVCICSRLYLTRFTFGVCLWVFSMIWVCV